MLLAALLLLVGAGLVVAGSAALANLNQTQAGQTSLTGTLNIQWGDPDPSSGNTTLRTNYTLTDDSGATTPLAISDSVLQASGGSRALNKQRISVTGALGIAPSGGGTAVAFNVTSIVVVNPQGALSVPDALVSGSKAYVNIACNFPDSATANATTSYLNGMVSDTYPGLSHFWRELSYDNVNLLGSASYTGASGLGFTLPHPRSYYLGFATGKMLDYLAIDCTEVADSTVNFASFFGINLTFNEQLDGYAWGGTTYLARDGVSGIWPITWEPPWGWKNQTVLAHETGHSLGLPHSKDGAQSGVYTNNWDLLSNAWYPCNSKGFSDSVYGCLGQHTISYHMDMQGWIPTGQKKTVASGTSQLVTLERMAQPTTSDYLMAQIPISSTYFYTIEARKVSGYSGTSYDVGLPSSAVVIHSVSTIRSEDAWFVAALVSPGDTYTIPETGDKISLYSTTATGFQVVINNTPPAAPTALTATGVAGPRVNLSWTDNSTNEDSFVIERSPNNTTWSTVGSVGANVTAYADSAVTSDTTYYYRVYAHNSAGNSFTSNTATVSTPLNAPTALTATPNVSVPKVDLSWTDHSAIEDNFIIQRSNDNTTWSNIGSVGANVTAYADTAITLCSPYYYRVYAQNAYNTSANATASVSLLLPASEAPTNLSGYAYSTTQVRLSWTNNACSLTGQPITFEITRNSSPLTTTANNEVDDTNASAGVSYTYQVTAKRNGTTTLGVSNSFPFTMPTRVSRVGSDVSLNNALNTAGANQVIEITGSFSINSTLTYQPKQGVLLVGGCDASGPTITITSNQPLNLSLSGVTIYGIAFVGHGDATHPELKMLAPGAGNAPNRMVCTTIHNVP